MNRKSAEKRAISLDVTSGSFQNDPHIRYIKSEIQAFGKQYPATEAKIAELLQQSITIPDYVFNESLTALQSIVKYLKEERSLKNSEIAKIAHISQKSVWQAYRNSKAIQQEAFTRQKAAYAIPLSALKPGLTALESVVFHLRITEKVSFRGIADILRRDQRTIWTLFRRAEKKSAKRAAEDLAEDKAFIGLKAFTQTVTKRYHVSVSDILASASGQVSIPDTVFSKERTILQSIVHYLRDKKGFRNKAIAGLLHVSEKSASQAYRNARRGKDLGDVAGSRLHIPVSEFKQGLTAPESVVLYLHDKLALSFSGIGRILHRDPRTIWAAYALAMKKETGGRK